MLRVNLLPAAVASSASMHSSLIRYDRSTIESAIKAFGVYIAAENRPIRAEGSNGPDWTTSTLHLKSHSQGIYLILSCFANTPGTAIEQRCDHSADEALGNPSGGKVWGRLDPWSFPVCALFRRWCLRATFVFELSNPWVRSSVPSFTALTLVVSGWCLKFPYSSIPSWFRNEWKCVEESAQKIEGRVNVDPHCFRHPIAQFMQKSCSRHYRCRS